MDAKSVDKIMSSRRKEAGLVIDKKLTEKETGILAATSSICARTVSAPIERIKILIQCQNELIKNRVLNDPYKGIKDCYTRTVAAEGFRSLWRGNMAQVVRCVHTQEINLVFKDRIMQHFKVTNEMPTWKKMVFNVVSGGLAGVLTDCFLYSFDFCRTQMAVDLIDSQGKRKFHGFHDVYGHIYKQEGIRGLYRGFGVSSVGIFIYRGLYFGLHDTLKPIVLPENYNFAQGFALAYVVTVFAMQAVYPIDTLRRRMMVTSGTGYSYSSSVHCLRAIVAFEGSSALFKGSSANVLRGTAGALVLAVFDRLKKSYLQRKNDQN